MATKPKKKRGELKKETLTTYVRFECDRQLLWLLGREDTRWLNEVRELKRAPHRPESSQKLFDLGHEFEQEVYVRLQNRLLDTFVNDSNNKVIVTRMNPDAWRDYASTFFEEGKSAAFLLEHEFNAPQRLLKRWLGSSENDRVPILEPQFALRPDIIVLEKPSRETPQRALGADGEEYLVHTDDERLSVRFVDIKYTSPESVGKKHFIELLYYAHAFALYLQEEGLDDIFFVPLDGHGIFAQSEDNRRAILGVEDFDEMIEPLIWRDQAHLLTSVRDVLSTLWQNAPHHPRDVEARLQPACVLCPFLGECQDIAGYDPALSSHPDASIELLAYTSPSVMDQLQAQGIDTIQNLNDRDIPDPQTPTPLAAERPMLRLKARSLISGEVAWATEGEQGTQRHLSMALPRYSDSVLTFALEQDPTNDRIFVYGLSLDLRLKDTQSKDGEIHVRPYAVLHDRVWTALAARLAGRSKETVEELVDRIFVDTALDEVIAASAEITHDQIRDRRVIRIKRMMELMEMLDREGSLQVDLTREFHEHAWIRAKIGDFNTDTNDVAERKLVRRFVRHGVAIVELVALYEELVVGIGTYEDKKTKELKEYLVHPSSGIFFWSHEQMEHVRALMERHLIFLMTGSDVYREFRLLLELVAPSESGIQKHYRHRKIFDLRRFVETSVGLPQIINYTWHETAHALLPNRPIFERRYWSPHYNYMLFVMWHEALDHGGLAEKTRLVEEATNKAKVVGQLVRTFQGRGRHHGVISHESNALKTRQILSHRQDIPPDYHFLARAWAQYSRLDATLQEQVAVDQRLTFPLASIGKLMAAHVSHLTYRVEEKDVFLEFLLEGLSANVKFKPGDFVYLIHETRRDIKPHEWGRDTIVLDNMRWDGSRNAYRVEAHAYSHSTKAPATIADFPELTRDGWYLYNSTVDVWTDRLTRVLASRGLGTSWLGSRRALMLDLMPADEELLPPESMSFDVAECAMFAPELLPETTPTEPFELRTTAYPRPDPSQERAIEQAFRFPMSCILGPPGTGKSQTMTGLIDEFLCRNPDGPLKILVSASSYEPMSVVLNKLQAHQDENGEPTPAAMIPKVWLHSSSRDGLDRDDILDFCIDGDRMLLDGVQVQRRKKSRLYEDEKWRMDDSLPDRFVLFGVPHQLAQLIKRNSKGQDRYLHIDHFAFDLVVVDEASQMPVDQATALLPLIHRGRVGVGALDLHDPTEPIIDVKAVETLQVERMVDEGGEHLPPEKLTRLVFVGDHNQLPPVQQIEPPRKLLTILESAFAYFQEYLGVPSVQLQTNYRSRQEIVDYTNSLDLYEHEIIAYFATHTGIPSLPSPAPSRLGWLDDTLQDDHVVCAMIHDDQFDTAVSELEATLVAKVVEGVYWQVSPNTPERERQFWSHDIGIVSPHNAHGRLITRMLYEMMLRNGSHLSDDELMHVLGETTYSVEKFQGSARTFILASMGISSIDQIKAEETFIYDLNRLNVLTSRAVQKMLLICSQNLLNHVPITRHMVGPAARLRDYAYRYCNAQDTFEFNGREIARRWHVPSLNIQATPAPPIRITPPTTVIENAETTDELEDFVGGLSAAELERLRKMLGD